MKEKIRIIGNQIKNYKDYKKAEQIFYKSLYDSFIVDKSTNWSQATFENHYIDYTKKGYKLYSIYYKDRPSVFSTKKDTSIENLVNNYAQQYLQGTQNIDKFLKDLKHIIGIK